MKKIPNSQPWSRPTRQRSAAHRLRTADLYLLLDRIPVSSVPHATVRTLKPKKSESFLKNLRFFPALDVTQVYYWRAWSFCRVKFLCLKHEKYAFKRRVGHC